MANDPPLLASTTPSAVAPANAFIGHGQLRDLVICPRERGILNYVQEHAIIEHNIVTDESRILAPSSFSPNTLAALPLNSHDTLLAAGGQDAEIHLSCHTNSTHHAKGTSRSKRLWQMEQRLPGSINNSVFLTSLSLTRSNQSAVEPRLGVSNNDCTVRLYEVPVRTQNQKRNLIPIGSLRLDVPINHSSISPDGRTLLSVGDSSKIYFHHMRGSDPVQFEHIHNLLLPPPDTFLYPSSLAASFSTAFSNDGMKFAVASQEGVLAVWDIRSTKPIKVIQTDKRRGMSEDGYLSDDPTDWMRGRSKAPGFSVRSVKFGGGCGYGKEVLTFTEHTSLLHVVDARTFETEEILKVPTVRATEQQLPPPPPQNHRSDLSPPPVRVHDRRSQFHRHVFSSLTAAPQSPTSHLGSSPSSPRRSSSGTPQPRIIQALNDAFRVSTPSYSPPSSISDSTWRTIRPSHVRNVREGGVGASGAGGAGGNGTGDDYDEIVVIPSLGDRNLESEVHALLNPRNNNIRRYGAEEEEEEAGEGEDRNTGSTHGDYEYRVPASRSTSTFARQGDDMEVDELESDCLSSRTPSRSTSPVPPQTSSSQDRHTPTITSHRSRTTTTRQEPKPSAVEVSYRDDLDIAGTCFDPSGRHIYVATKESLVEWSLRDADKRWWTDISWR